MFLLPALALLGFLVIYPVIATIWRSFFDTIGDQWVGLDNYRRMFALSRMRTAIVNSLIWVAIFPIVVTTIGLILAVLSERIKWRTAFRLVLFVPIAIAAMSSGIIWRIMYETEPTRGFVNAVINIPVSAVNPEGPLAGAGPSFAEVIEDDDGSIVVQVEVGPDGGVARIGLVRIAVGDVPDGSIEARDPAPSVGGTVVGVVWRDTRPGDDERGVVEPGELGLANVPVEVLGPDGSIVGSGLSDIDGTFAIDVTAQGVHSVAIPQETFRSAWGGVQWLGADLITISAIIAGVWIWAGFALVMIGAGLSALPQSTLEAARVDGASEWQVFRRVTIPQLAPILGVVFISLTIGALKMFDLILGLAPGSVQADANVIALEMWRTSFSGLGERGLGSAIAVFLFLMIIPLLLFNIRRFRLQEANR